MKALRRLPLGSLTDRPDHELVGVLRMPELTVSPLRSIVKRVVGATLALLLTVIIVYLDRDGYRDANGDGLSLLDSLYYATVSLSTTGYGDIAPATSSARLVNVLVITPLRVMFLIVLVGTTLEVLTERSRQALKIQRWRQKLRAHTVVVGYGTKGRSAVSAMLGDEPFYRRPDRRRRHRPDDARRRRRPRAGHRARLRHPLRRAPPGRVGLSRAKAVLVATNRDDTAVLVTLTARARRPTPRSWSRCARRRTCTCSSSPARTSVVVSSETAGRLLGIATATPSVVAMVEDLLTPDAGLAIAEREVEKPR